MSKYRNGGRVELDVERFPQNRTSMFWLIFIRALFSDFVEGFARIPFTLNEHSPVKITLLKVPQNVECHTHTGMLAVRCTAPVLPPANGFCHICQTVFSDTLMLNLT